MVRRLQRVRSHVNEAADLDMASVSQGGGRGKYQDIDGDIPSAMLSKAIPEIQSIDETKCGGSVSTTLSTGDCRGKYSHVSGDVPTALLIRVTSNSENLAESLAGKWIQI